MNTAVPFQAEKPIFRKLESIADVAMLTHDERVHYNISLNSFRTSLAVMEHEHNVGRAEGIEQGRAEGRAEERESLNTDNIRRMRQKGLDDATIADLLNLDMAYVNVH